MIRGADIILHLEPSDTVKHSRISKIICQLNNKDHSITPLGNLTSTNKGNKSVWDLKNYIIITLENLKNEILRKTSVPNSIFIKYHYEFM